MRLKHSQKLLLISSTVILLFLGILSWSVQSKIDSSAREEVGQSLRAVLDTSHQAIKSWAQDHRNMVQIWANFSETRRVTRQLLQLPRDRKTLIGSPAQNEIRQFLRSTLDMMGYEGFLIIGPNKVNLASSRDQNTGLLTLPASQEKFFQQIFSGHTALLLPEKSVVPLPDEDGQVKEAIPTMFVGAPVFGDSGQVIAIFAFRLNPFTAFTSTLQQGRMGKTGETYAFDNQARLISNSRFDEELHKAGMLTPDQKAILNIKLLDPGKDFVNRKNADGKSAASLPLTRMAESAINGHSGIDLDGYCNYRGKEVVGAWRWDPELGIGLATEMDKDEAYESAKINKFVLTSLTVFAGVLLIGLVIFIIVYHQRVIAEQQLRDSESRIRLLLESIGEGVFGVDLEGNCTFVNSAAVNMLGYNNSSELVGKHIHPLIHHTQSSGNPCHEDTCMIYAAFRDAASYFVDDEILWRSDNTSFEVQYHSTPLYHKGKISGAVVSFADITGRRQAEHALRQSEQRYRQIFNSILDVYAEIDLDGTILEVSPSVEIHTQYSRDELLGRFMGDFYARPEDREKLLAQIYRDGMINDYESIMVLKDGSQRPFSFTGKIITDDTGKPLKLAGVMRDISERKKADKILREGAKELEVRIQERTSALEVANVELKHEIEERKHAEIALRENELFIQTVLNTLPDSIAVIDKNGYIQSVNKAWEAFAAKNSILEPLNSSVGTNYLEVCHSATGVDSKEAELAARGIEDLIKGKRNYFSMEYPCHSADKKRWFEMHAMPFQDNELSIVISHTDITERKQSEEALRAERDKAQRYLDTVEAIIVSLDRDGNINLINRKGCQILGYTEQELLGKNWFKTCLPLQYREEVYGIFKDIIAGNVSASEYFENPVLTKQGEERLIAWHNSYFCDNDGNIISSLGAGEDITERVRAEELARQHQTEMAHLARLNTAGEMATGIAHELNQPLSAIVTYTDVALRMVNSDKKEIHKLTEALEGARSQANRAAEIIRHLRQLVAKKSPKKTKTSLNDLIEESIQLDLGELRKNQINYSLELEETLPLIYMDRIQIELVLLNLINNSIDAMQQGAKTKRNLVIQTGIFKNDYAKVTIIDNGPGIDTETQRKMFEPFFTSKGERGMGLGLSISRSIIENHHGVLTVESKPGHGANFSFTLPLNQAGAGLT